MKKGTSDNYPKGEAFTGYGCRDLTKIIPEENRWRFYRIEIGQALFSPYLVRAWGRIGSRVRVIETFCASLDELIKEANRIYKRKVKRGYKEVKSIKAPEFR